MFKDISRIKKRKINHEEKMGNILANVPDVHFLANKLWQGI